MPGLSTKFLEEVTNKALHPDWKELKSKYAEVLTWKQVKFDQKLGPMLDKRTKTIKSVQGYKAKAAWVIVKPLLSSLRSNANALDDAADIYLQRVAGLTNPAKKDFETFLHQVKLAAENDRTWVQVKTRDFGG